MVSDYSRGLSLLFGSRVGSSGSNVVRRCASGFLRLRFHLRRLSALHVVSVPTADELTTPDIWSDRLVMRAARHRRQPYQLKCESSSRSLPRSMKG